MQDKFALKNAKISEIYAFKGNYEGSDYYRAVAELDNGLKLQVKLTAFEFNTLKAQNR